MIELLSELFIPLTVMLGLVFIVHKPLLNRFGAQCAYWLWLLVPVSLVGFLISGAGIVTVGVANGQVERLIVNSTTAIKSGFDEQWLSVVWLIGTIGFVLCWLVNHLQLSKKLKLQAYQLPKNLVEVPHNLHLYQSAHTFSPLLMGIFKQKLVVPEDFDVVYNTEQQKLILEHEICHFDRNDIYWNLVAFSFIALFWFHPMVWLAYFRFRRDQELSCDQSVLARKQLNSRINYSKALLVSAQASPPVAFAHLTFKQYGDKEIMFERIKHIKSDVKTSKLGLAAVLALAVTGVTSMSYAGSVGAGKSSNDNTILETKVAYEAKPIKRIEPKYPADAMVAQTSGSVLLKYDIDQNGKVFNVEVIKAKPQGVFDEAAKNALVQWEYEPHKYNVIAGNYVQLDFLIDEKAKKSHLIESIKVKS